MRIPDIENKPDKYGFPKGFQETVLIWEDRPAKSS